MFEVCIVSKSGIHYLSSKVQKCYLIYRVSSNQVSCNRIIAILQNPDYFCPDTSKCPGIEVSRTGKSPFSLLLNTDIRKPGNYFVIKFKF